MSYTREEMIAILEEAIAETERAGESVTRAQSQYSESDAMYRRLEQIKVELALSIRVLLELIEKAEG